MTYLISILIIFGLFAAWAVVQEASRRFAARHPEFGPAREEGEGCGFTCPEKKAESCPMMKAGLCSLNLPQTHSNHREEAP
jgi:hypothetical protein